MSSVEALKDAPLCTKINKIVGNFGAKSIITCKLPVGQYKHAGYVCDYSL